MLAVPFLAESVFGIGKVDLLDLAVSSFIKLISRIALITYS
jgi:hypothetical protein